MNFNGTVLLIDDEAHIRKYVGLILRGLGNPTLIEATNGQEGVAAYQRENPDLVLLDVNMPIMDGIETLTALKQIDPDCVVIMLTSLANRQTIEQTSELGAVNYVRKDSSREELTKALTETIESCFETE